MKSKGLFAAALGLAAAVTSATIVLAAEDRQNWMREYVELRKKAVVERAVGPERAADIAASNSARIVGGQPAAPKANPFQVGLLARNVASNYRAQYCGGVLYRPNVVITAAHCSDFVKPGQVQVLTGTRSLDGTGERRNVASIHIHDKWNPITFDYDIAVWILRSSKFGVRRPLLAKPKFEKPGEPALVTGWGSTGSGFPVDLMQVKVPLQPRKDCNDADSYNGWVTKRMICAGFDAGGKDSCQGDSGGPLTLKVKLPNGVGAGQFYRLVGIVSWGVGCGLPELFGVYTRISQFRGWIHRQIP